MTVLSRMAKMPIFLILTKERLIGSDRAGLSPNINFTGEVMTTEGNFGNFVVVVVCVGTV